MNYKVSIILPVYNAERYLAECLDSVLGQSYDDIEVIIVNDGSTDSSYEIIKSYASDSRVVVLSQENKGVSVARNYGLTMASGYYTAFIDADDRVSADYIENLLEHARAGSYVLTMDDLLYMRVSNAVWGKLFRSEDVKRCQFTPGLVVAEDLEYNYKLLTSGAIVTVANEALYYYRKNNDSATRSRYNHKRMGGLRMIECVTPTSKAVINRTFNEAFFIMESIIRSRSKKRNIEDYRTCLKALKSTRLVVLFDKQSLFRTRIVALSSYVSITCYVYCVGVVSLIRDKITKRIQPKTRVF